MLRYLQRECFLVPPLQQQKTHQTRSLPHSPPPLHLKKWIAGQSPNFKKPWSRCPRPPLKPRGQGSDLPCLKKSGLGKLAFKMAAQPEGGNFISKYDYHFHRSPAPPCLRASAFRKYPKFRNARLASGTEAPRRFLPDKSWQASRLILRDVICGCCVAQFMDVHGTPQAMAPVGTHSTAIRAQKRLVSRSCSGFASCGSMVLSSLGPYFLTCTCFG